MRGEKAMRPREEDMEGMKRYSKDDSHVCTWHMRQLKERKSQHRREDSKGFVLAAVTRLVTQ
jgi:hypothetical protein